MRVPFGRPALRLLTAALLAIGATSAHAVVESGHWGVNHRLDISIANPANTNLSFNVHQTIEGDGTGTFFAYDNKTGKLRYVTHNVDESSQMFVVRPGDVLSRGTASQFIALSGDGVKAGLTFDAGKDFYLGVGTRSLSDPDFSWAPGAWTSWGWAHLKQNASGQLVLVDSAIAFREGGIVVGTLQAVVPEPATWATWAIGLAGLAALRKTRHSLKG